MGFLDSVLKVFVGDKSKQDLSVMQPLVQQIKQHESAMAGLSLNELRAKSEAFRAQIKADQAEIEQQIQALYQDIDKETDIDKKEDLYHTIDQLKDARYAVEKQSLDALLPEAFAVIKGCCAMRVRVQIQE
jgi:preprotein translocase subunit SecA